MWNTFTQAIFQYISPISILLGSVLTLSTIWTWQKNFVGEGRRKRRWLHEVRNNPGQRPSILIVDLLPGKDIEATVENYRQQHDALKNIPTDRIFVIRRDERVTPNNVQWFADKVRENAVTVTAAGTDVLHFFYGGPAVTAAIVGVEFANACPVIMYQFTSISGTAGYENWGPIRLH